MFDILNVNVASRVSAVRERKLWENPKMKTREIANALNTVTTTSGTYARPPVRVRRYSWRHRTVPNPSDGRSRPLDSDRQISPCDYANNNAAGPRVECGQRDGTRSKRNALVPGGVPPPSSTPPSHSVVLNSKFDRLKNDRFNVGLTVRTKRTYFRTVGRCSLLAVETITVNRFFC